MGWTCIFGKLILRWMSADAISVQAKSKSPPFQKNGERWAPGYSAPAFSKAARIPCQHSIDDAGDLLAALATLDVGLLGCRNAVLKIARRGYWRDLLPGRPDQEGAGETFLTRVDLRRAPLAPVAAIRAVAFRVRRLGGFLCKNT